MTEEKSPKKVGSVKIEPLQGQFFDIMPAKNGRKSSALGSRSGFFGFAVIAFIALMILGIGNAYIQGRELAQEGKESVHTAYENLKGGMDALMGQDGEGAMQYFTKARKAFDELSESTRHLTLQADQLSSQNLYLDTADALVESALEVTEIGQQLSLLMQDITALPGQILTGGKDFDVMGLVHTKEGDIKTLLSRSASLQRKLTASNLDLLPSELAEKIRTAQGQVGQFIAALLEVEGNFDVVLTLLGDEVPHRYLVLFQNNHERRATGGFIGSYMIVDVNDGKITKMEAKDIYETDGQLADLVKAPAGIDQVADRLYMRDANYSPDFPTSARQIMWFLEHSKGPSVDTVIAIDQTLVENIIKLVGPMHLPSFPYQINANNFTDIISFHTEAKITDTATPKQLLFDLIPAFKESLAGMDNLGQILEVGRKMAERGHIQIYSQDARLEALSQRLGISGEIATPTPKTDYLSVITTSIGGNKSDQYMTMDLQHDTWILEDGVLTDKLVIRKRHDWGQEEETKIANMIKRFGTGKLTEEDLYFILGRGPNVDYVRVYVPKGSMIQSVEGLRLEEVDVSEDLGYTVFGFTVGPVYPREEKEISLSYRLPYSLNLDAEESYYFMAQNQSGAEKVLLTKSLHPAEGILMTDTFPKRNSEDKDNFTFKGAFEQDQISIAELKRD